MASPEAGRVEELFRLLGRFSWESFVQNRLPLLSLPEDLREALKQGKPEKPWIQEVGERLRRLDLEALPPEKRERVERHLQALRELLAEEV